VTKDERPVTIPLRLSSFLFRRQGVHVETDDLPSRIAAIQERINAAARRAGRDPAEVTLVAVSKTHTPEEVAAAYAAGLRLFGENRVEEAAPKAEAVARLVAPAPPPAWHMVGHVQSRKAEDVLPWAAMVQSVDSVKLAARLSRFVTAGYASHSRQTGHAEECTSHSERSEESPSQDMLLGMAGPRLPVLLEVNVSGEASKYGFRAEELPDAVEAIAALPGLTLQGLMTVAPIAADPEDVRPVFAALRALRDDLARRYPALDWRHLSMGMTDDFEVAIEEGATLVRVGRAIFGERT
jgi:PLP dependent protein